MQMPSIIITKKDCFLQQNNYYYKVVCKKLQIKQILNIFYKGYDLWL